jgi:hypothetical protein
MKKFITALVLAFVLALPATASAENHASACGANHGTFANVNGNFGWLGELGGTPGYHGAVGQEPGATGYNNSSSTCQE